MLQLKFGSHRAFEDQVSVKKRLSQAVSIYGVKPESCILLVFPNQELGTRKALFAESKSTLRPGGLASRKRPRLLGG